MSISDFLKHRFPCPMCGSDSMPPSFLGGSSKVRFDGDRLDFTYVMKALRANQPDYEATYSFDLDTNSFGIKLSSEWNNGDWAQLHLIEKFKKFDDNKRLPVTYFSRQCLNCYKYALHSEIIRLDFKNATYTEPKIITESFTFVEEIDDGYRFIRLDNYPEHSDVLWWRSPVLKLNVPLNFSYKALDSVIPFVSEKETHERISKLLTFL